MPIEFHCRNCRNLVRTPDETAGQLGKCPHCDAVMKIPSPAGADGESGERGSESETAAEDEPPAIVGHAYYAENTSGLPPHRGSMIVSFGISSTVLAVGTALSCACCPFIGVGTAATSAALGVASIVMGRRDLRAMEAGEMDPAGRAPSTIGLVLGIVGVALSLLALLFIVLIFLLQFGMMAASSANP